MLELSTSTTCDQTQHTEENPVRLTRSMTQRLAIGVGAAALGFITLPALGATAAPTVIADNSNGVGVCMSQIAIEPGVVGVDHLGQGIRSLAGRGTAGSDVPSALNGERNACGEPPGPGHLP